MSTSITILGNTGRDVELRYTANGTPVANFSVASNTVRNTPNGQQKKTDWFNVSAFGKQAETLAKYLTKGSQILVRGRLSFNPWLSRDGEARVSADVVMQDFEFAGSNPNKSSSESAYQPVADSEEVQEISSGAGMEIDDEERAEILAAINDPAKAMDEPFAGQF